VPVSLSERLERAVGRLPATVYAKLIVPFVGSAVLLVVLGLLGLQVLRDSNNRVEALGTLQLKAAAYGRLQADVTQLSLLLGLRAGGGDMAIYVGESPASAPTSSELAYIDQTIATTLTSLRPATDVPHLGFTVPPQEAAILNQARNDYVQLSGVMTRINAFDQAGKASDGSLLQGSQAEPLVTDLILLSQKLVATSQAQADSLIAQNGSSFTDSQNLFIAVGAASIVLALLLGYLLSLSVIGPIRKMDTRLAAIASGDFSGHVNVSNRDELGALASNLNRMNDELGRVYGELATASRHKSEFLANMSHELRTPLNAIIGFSQVLREQMFGEMNEKQIDYVNDILSSGQHLLSVINDILDLAKVEAGHMALQPAIFPLGPTLENAVNLMRERATRQGITLATDIDPSLGLIEADERKLKQVLFNLLSNAVKFTPRGGRVTLSAHGVGDQLEISVDDTGVGVSAQDQARIFDDFYQVASGEAQEGTGLGLALTRRLVELQGGEIRVVSDVGAGSKFSFTMPNRLEPAAAAAVRP
jgi:signal transduction histidine kinase